MNDGETRPVEHLFGDKAIPARVARGVAVCRALRQIDDRRHARFLRGLREIYGRMDQARLDRPTKVSRIDTFHCCADGVDL